MFRHRPGEYVRCRGGVGAAWGGVEWRWRISGGAASRRAARWWRWGEGGAVAHLLSAEDLHCRGGLLGEVHERAGVRDQSRADELAHHRRQVGRDRLAAHAPRVSVCMCRVHVP